jgi:hypothetical protein
VAALPFPGVPPGASLTLTDGQTAQWAQQAGFVGQDLVTAIAVSIAEDTSRRIDAVHVNGDGSRDYGPWQINDRAHADLFTQYPQWWTVYNADMAYSVWQHGGGWPAWSTYQSGAYQQYLARASTAVSTLTGQQATAPGSAPDGAPGQVSTTNSLTQIGNSVATIAGDVYRAAAWLADPHNWTRVALVVLGGIIVIGTVVKTTTKSTGITPATIAKATA